MSNGCPTASQASSAAARDSSRIPRTARTASPKLEATTTSFRLGLSSSMVVFRASRTSRSSWSRVHKSRKLFCSATALPPTQFKIEILCDHLRLGEPVVEGKASSADQEALGNDSGVVSCSKPATRLFDHRLFLRLEGDDLRQTLVTQRWIGPEAHRIDGERAGFGKGIK